MWRQSLLRERQGAFVSSDGRIELLFFSCDDRFRQRLLLFDIFWNSRRENLEMASLYHLEKLTSMVTASGPRSTCME